MVSTGLLRIDLAAVSANWTLISQYINHSTAGAECAAVVKADAYGLGVVPVVEALRSVGCQRFFVATLNEAVELREAVGTDVSIIVLGGLSHGLSDEWSLHRLTPVLFDLAHIHQWLAYCRSKGKRLPCVIKVDTGMHRLGILPEQVDSLLLSPGVEQQLLPEMLMSHLACADESGHTLNALQLSCFKSVAQKIKTVYPGIGLSLSNSSGIFLGGDFHFDVCRPGAALYGVNPTPHQLSPVKSVVSLSLPVMQSRTINSGESVGYGATFVAHRETRLVTVFGGYGDGLLRAISNQGYGWYSGVKVPIAGRVSMDSIIFDVTDVHKQSDCIEILNDIQGVDDIAKYAGTIGYEVLTSLGSRYRREYINRQSSM